MSANCIAASETDGMPVEVATLGCRLDVSCVSAGVVEACPGVDWFNARTVAEAAVWWMESVESSRSSEVGWGTFGVAIDCRCAGVAGGGVDSPP
jgi:hypothetical protein